MISGIFHSGSGLGNQLHRYVATRVLALDNEPMYPFHGEHCDFGMINPENFKGISFMNLDMGVPVDLLEREEHWEMNEKKVVNEEGNDIRPYDSDIVACVHDNTIVDGEFQDEKYFGHHLDKVREWLKVEPIDIPDDVCVIGFRGGEYVGVPGLFLPESYWQEAINKILEKYPEMTFEVHTDDHDTARAFFPWLPIVQDMERNWRSVRYAKHLIIANSSFYILPSLLGDAKEIIAPKFWAGRNKGYWQLEQNQYKRFTYI